jgi:predicted nucleotide-binding protein
MMSRDVTALQQGVGPAPHQEVLARVVALKSTVKAADDIAELVGQAASHIGRKKKEQRSKATGNRIFIGHGRSGAWRELKDFIADRLHLEWDEFNRTPTPGRTHTERLTEMLDSSAIALLVLTAEDELKDGKQVARQNVVHEAGLFQGRLGWQRAIILLEEGCDEFSNIAGLGQIRFPSGHIASCFEEVRRFLEREGVV